MGALAPAKKIAPQEVRTFFISTVAWSRRSIFQTSRMAQLFLDVLRENRQKARFQVHAFVVMPNHCHVLVTPAADVSLEKCIQYIKGGFSFRAKKELGFAGEVWQEGFNEHRVKDTRDYHEHLLLHSRKSRTGRDAERSGGIRVFIRKRKIRGGSSSRTPPGLKPLWLSSPNHRPEGRCSHPEGRCPPARAPGELALLTEN
jgi:putative transposase